MMIKERNEILKRINTSVISPEALSRYVVSAVYTYMFPDKRLPETVKVSLDESILENVKKGINDLAVSEMRELTEDMISGESVYKSLEKSNSYISQLAANLLDIQQGETVLDFGCGEGAFLAYVMKLCKDQGMDISLSGVEINELNSKIAEMALEILGGELKVTTGDFLERTTKLPDYDKAYVYPPFALKKTSGIKYQRY